MFDFHTFLGIFQIKEVYGSTLVSVNLKQGSLVMRLSRFSLWKVRSNNIIAYNFLLTKIFPHTAVMSYGLRA